MNLFSSLFTSRVGWIPALLAILVAGCGGGLDPILGGPGVGIAPTVTATSPLASTPVVTGVAVNSLVTATFSKPMAPATLTPTSFMLACPAGTPVAAAVTYDATTRGHPHARCGAAAEHAVRGHRDHGGARHHRHRAGQ